ncbi:MAG: prepilin-type N-terminal cleavage/methylation domain-containing protein [Terriglobales bacterium]|jgi:prepilin-type N-terminal cleavage/methylation domain-containing protein
MKSREINAGHGRHRASGFSLIEMVIVVAIVVILGAIAFMSLQPLLQQQHVTNAYNTTMAAMRQARDNAIAQQTSYEVIFSNASTPNTIVVQPTTTFSTDLPTATYSLPTDVSFSVVSVSGTQPTAPDGYGTGAAPIDFGYASPGSTGGGNVPVYFCPDGSAQIGGCGSGTAGYWMNNWDGGVVYIARPGNLPSSRAVTLWGATGRIRGWRLYGKSGGYQWIRQ